MASPDLSLSVNGVAISLDRFTSGFVSSVVNGMLAALRGTGKAKKVDIAISGEEVSLDLDGDPVPVNPFVNKILKNTLSGMVSSLRGVSRIDSLEIHMTG